MTSEQENAKILLEMEQHPERFCPVCSKRVGVCSHTKEQMLDKLRAESRKAEAGYNAILKKEMDNFKGKYFKEPEGKPVVISIFFVSIRQ